MSGGRRAAEVKSGNLVLGSSVSADGDAGVRLQVAHITKRFGGITVLDDVNMAAGGGQVIGIIGPNGAGKPTVVNVLTGLVKADIGSWSIDGARMERASAAAVAETGVARTFQTPRGSGDATVLRNIALPVLRHRDGLLRGIGEGGKGWEHGLDKAVEAAKICGLFGVVNKLQREVSGGEARMLEVARVLAADPRIVFLDEPTAGLDVGKQERVAQAIEILRSKGATVFVVEHNLEFLLAQVPRVVVMAGGAILAECDPSEVRVHPEVRRVYFGDEVSPASLQIGVVKGAGVGGGSSASERPHEEAAFSGSGLMVKSLCGGYGKVEIIHDITVDVASGEAVAVAGANGAGKSTLLKLLSGILPVQKGELRYRGLDLRELAAQQRNGAGMFHLPQEVVAFGKLTVSENIQLAGRSPKGRKDREARVDEALSLFPALRTMRNKAAGSLSGGERQMLGLACAWASGCELLLLDEPTSGLAPRIVDVLTQTIAEFLNAGKTVLWVVEQAPRTALELVDRVYVLVEGVVAYSGSPRNLGGSAGLAELILGGPSGAKDDGLDERRHEG